MAAPHVAGVAALLRESRPQAYVGSLKAAIVNTADPSELVNYATLREGSGLVDADEAIETPVVAIGDRTSGSLSLGSRRQRERSPKSDRRPWSTGSTGRSRSLPPPRRAPDPRASRP